MLKSRLRDSGRQVPEFEPQTYLHVKDPVALSEVVGEDQPALPIPRLFSDKCVNIYFQEWAPLFPVVHRPTFLTSYQKYVANSDESIHKTSLAHLNLVFSIAALSKGTVVEELEVFESQWKAAIDEIMNDNRLNYA